MRNLHGEGVSDSKIVRATRLEKITFGTHVCAVPNGCADPCLLEIPMPSPPKKLLRKAYPIYRPILRYLGSLDVIARIHATDKAAHGYITHYQTHLQHLRSRRVKILEIGVGGYNDPGQGGSSLRMWKDYFPRGEIFALDIHDKRSLQEDRIKIFIGDQSDAGFLDDFGKQHGPFDVIVDDGSHMSPHVITSFHALFPHVKPGGHYVVEDLFFSYDPEMGGSRDDLNTAETSVGMLKTLIDDMQYKYIPGRQPVRFGDQITGISFYPKICFIQKGDNSAPDTQVQHLYRHQQVEA